MPLLPQDRPTESRPPGALRQSTDTAAYRGPLSCGARTALRSDGGRKCTARRQRSYAGETLDVPTLILLGAAGGLLRGVLDLYTRFGAWQADRRLHRQLGAEGAAQGDPPRFQMYFDLAVDIPAAVVHSLMGAGAAVLFGTTGQISGEYAALVVGMSAPVLLTQLSRIQTVNEALTGPRQSAGGEEPAAQAVPSASATAMDAATSSESGSPQLPGAATAAAPSVALPGPDGRPTPASSTAAAWHSGFAEDPTHPVRLPSSSRPAAAAAEARAADPAVPGRLPADRTQSPQPACPADTSPPTTAAEAAGSGFDDQGTPRWRRGMTAGEEGA